MNQNNLTLGLIVILLVFLQSRPSDQTVASVVRANQIELVDKNGKTRASLKIEDGEETVFRIMDASGTIRVKLGGSRDGSGLILLNDSTEVGIHALAKGHGSFLKIEDEGKKRTIEP
ncbi:MAG TPA: hypothetical protein VFW11_23475 [Cyclobacteriaceae bacterium]|nr:hypothetical protein [Cyclobacteriaceae bacterium]